MGGFEIKDTDVLSGCHLFLEEMATVDGAEMHELPGMYQALAIKG